MASADDIEAKLESGDLKKDLLATEDDQDAEPASASGTSCAKLVTFDGHLGLS